MLKVLHGHVSPETAFIVSDYPYGFRLRCKMRYWLETAEKGAKAGSMRLMSQTTNPKITSREVWNTPKGSTYSDMILLVLNTEDGHVENHAVSLYSFCEAFDNFRNAFYEQMDERERKKFDDLVKISRKFNVSMWREYDEKHSPAMATQHE